MDTDMLQQLALSTQGSFIVGVNTKETINFIKSELEKMEQIESETELYSGYEDQFQWFLSLSLLFFTIDFVIPTKKSTWLRKFKIFT
jgi:Ca-activated chloride channel family protein